MGDEQPVSDFVLRSLAAVGAIAPRPLLGGYHIEVLDKRRRLTTQTLEAKCATGDAQSLRTRASKLSRWAGAPPIQNATYLLLC